MKQKFKQIKDHEKQLKEDLGLFDLKYDKQLDLNIEKVRHFMIFFCKMKIKCL